MSTREVYKKLRKIGKLPSPSQVALEVIRLCYKENSSIQEITAIVENDPALTVEFLKYANSSLLSSTVPVSTLKQAAVKLGMKSMVSLALSFSILNKSETRSCIGFDYDRFWAKSTAQAIAARELSQKQGRFDPEEIFTCALLSHIGELALATTYPDKYSEIRLQELPLNELCRAERDTFGISHTELAAEMFLDWGLPEKFYKAIRLHEFANINKLKTHLNDDELENLVKLLHLSLNISDICLLELPLSRGFGYVESLAEDFNVSADKFYELFDHIVSQWQDWSQQFQIKTQQCPLYQQIKTVEENSIEELIKNDTEEEILILAVDDDPITLLNLRKLLKAENRKVITVEDGDEALQVALKEKPDLIITDWRMPNMDGLELCKTLRKTANLRHIYIVMLTSNETDEELVQAFDAGADDYVVKPSRPNVLEARIRSGERLIRHQRTIIHDKAVIQNYASRLTTANRKLQTMAMTDALTGLPNRRSAMERMKDIVAEFSRYDEKLSCIIIDIDYFKKINDTYGHDNGDIVLREVAEIFSKNARSYDMVSRMGGEEFLIISTRSDRKESLQLAERLRSAVENHEISLSDGSIAKVTISLGVATWSDGYRNDRELFKAADSALYKAKNSGRNRVEASWL